MNRYYFYRKLAYYFHRITVTISPKMEINRYYKKFFDKKANLQHPQSLIEKIYWMQLHCDTNSWSLLADKYLMRDYVISRVGEKYLPKLLAKWDLPQEISFDSLPSQFVLKANNGCGDVIIIKNKGEADIQKIIRKMEETISLPFGYSGFEPHYLRIRPCIIAEELLIQNDELCQLSPNSMVDFKFWCFNGIVSSCLVTYGRHNGKLFLDLYDSEWNRKLDCLKSVGNDIINPLVYIKKPNCLAEMKDIASKLSHGQPEMRVDMYIVKGKPVIGELTMSSGYGYFTEDYYNYLGSLVDTNLLKVVK